MSKSYVFILVAAVIMSALVGCPSTPPEPTVVQVSSAAFGMADGTYTIRAYINAQNISSATFQLWQANSSHQYFPVGQAVEIQTNAKTVEVVETTSTYQGCPVYRYAGWWYYNQGGYYNPVPWAWYLANQPTTTSKTQTVAFNLYQGDGAVLYTSFTGLAKQPASGEYKVVVTGWDESGSQITGEDVVTDITSAPVQTKYTLVASVSPANSGSVSPSGTNSYDADTVVNLVATPAAGFKFSHWLVNGSEGEDHTGIAHVTMLSNIQLIACFVPETAETKFTLTTSASPANGGSITPPSGQYNADTVVPVTATPASGWQFSHWLVNGSVGEDHTGIAHVTMLSNIQLVAVFTPAATEQRTLTTSVIGNGTVTGAGTYAAGASVTVTATPANGWKFISWDGDAAGNANPLTVVMNTNKNIIATFTEIVSDQQYSLTTSVVGSGTVAGGGTYNAGANATLTATPASGWKFSGWSGDASGTTNPKTVVMNTNKNIIATFVKETTPPADGPKVSFTDNQDGTVGMRLYPGTYSLGEMIAVASQFPAGKNFANVTGTGAEFFELPDPYWFCKEEHTATWSAGNWSSEISLTGHGTDNNGMAVSWPIASNTVKGYVVPYVLLDNQSKRYYLNTGILPAERNSVAIVRYNNGGYGWNQ